MISPKRVGIGSARNANANANAKPGWQVDLEARAHHSRTLKSSTDDSTRIADEHVKSLELELAKYKIALEVIASGQADVPFHVAAEALGQRPTYSDLLEQVEDLRQINSVYSLILESVSNGADIKDFNFTPETSDA
jgi:hypothetical protein